MSSEICTFSQMKAGRSFQRVVARLLRHWHPRNAKKGVTSKGVDILLVDEKSTMLQASINVAYVPTFKPLLRDGGIFMISGFDVGRSNPRYKMTDFHLSIRFTETTSMVEVTDHPHDIPKQVFRFRNLVQLTSLADSNEQLPDVIGQLVSSRVFTKGMTGDLDRVLLVLNLGSGEKVRLSAFDERAIYLEDVLKTKVGSSCIVLATNINPRKFKGEVYLNTCPATRFFLDDDVDETVSFKKSLERSNALEKYKTVEKVEKVTISGLNEFILTADSQEIDFLCAAVIKGIEPKHGWNFISCTTCGKKMEKYETTLVCSNCSSESNVGDVKYRVGLVVEDETGTAVFTAFNTEMEKMVGIPAPALAAQMSCGGLAEEDSGLIPQVIKDLTGRKFTFQLRLVDYNYTSFHEAFTVSRVFPDEKDLPIPTFTTEGFPIAKGVKRVDNPVLRDGNPNTQTANKLENKKKSKIA